MAGVNLLLSSVVSLGLVMAELTNPGFVGRITEQGLDSARQEGIAILQQKLVKLTLPDFSGSFRVKVIGTVDYKFHSLGIHSFQLPHSAIVPVPNGGLKISIVDAFAELTGEWQVKKRRWISDHGSFDLKVEGLSISVGLRLGCDETGKPTVATFDCSTRISEVQVHISGRWSWLYNLFHEKIESVFKSTMENKVCEEVTASVSSRLQPHLQTLPVTAKIDSVAGIDYSLVGSPVTTADSLDLNLKGEFFHLAHRSPAPFSPPALALPVAHGRMLYFGISSYFFNTASDIYYKAGALTFDITDDMVPTEVKIRLNTASFGSLVPQVKKLYPNVPMKLRVIPASAPSLAITPDMLSLTPTVDVQAFAVLPNSSLTSLFVIEVSTSISADIAVNSTKIFGSLKVARLQLSLKHSDVGTFSMQLLQTLMNYYSANILVPQMNARLREGFLLPLLDHLQLSNTALQPSQDFLLFGADVQYGE